MRRDFHGKILNQFLSFFRQGQNYIREERNISAFLNFYLFLEGAYAKEGHWRNYEVHQDFLASTEFTTILQGIIDTELTPTARLTFSIKKRLSELTDPQGNPTPKNLDVDGIAWLMIKTRGSLFHFRFDNGLNQRIRLDDDYEALAFVSYVLAQKTLENVFDQVEKVYGELMEEQRKEKLKRGII